LEINRTKNKSKTKAKNKKPRHFFFFFLLLCVEVGLKKCAREVWKKDKGRWCLYFFASFLLCLPAFPVEFYECTCSQKHMSNVLEEKTVAVLY